MQEILHPPCLTKRFTGSFFTQYPIKFSLHSYLTAEKEYVFHVEPGLIFENQTPHLSVQCLAHAKGHPLESSHHPRDSSSDLNQFHDMKTGVRRTIAGIGPFEKCCIQQKHVFQGTAPYLAKLVNRTPISLGFMLDILSLIIFIRRLTTAKPLGLEFHQFTNSTDVLGNRSLGFDPLCSRTKKSSGCFHMQLDPQ